MPIILFFIYAIFYRVVTTFMFDYRMSVLASVVLAVATTVILFFTTAFYAAGIGRNKFKKEFRDNPPPLLVDTLLPFFIATVVNCGVGWLVAAGFSERFFKGILMGYRHGDTNTLWFFGILAIPVFVHYMIVLSASDQIQ